ncbi:MAG TPA: ABC transporter permease [Gemmatimonadaceae bacterium]|nr:ABC transporter permease [Gemmatimonadaceae bacterium]
MTSTQNGDGRSTPTRLRLYSALLYCYPASYRTTYGDEMRDVFAQRLAADPPRWGLPGYALASTADVLPNAARVHIDLLRADLGYVTRAFRRSPWTLAGVIGVLAIGVGAASAVFNVLYGVAFRPLPYSAADRLAMVWMRPRDVPTAAPRRGVAPQRKSPSLEHGLLVGNAVLGLRRDSHGLFRDLAAIESWQGNLAAQFDLPFADHVERLHGAYVTPNFFALLDVHPYLGNLFADQGNDDDAASIVVSYRAWREYFGADPSIVGRPLTLTVGRSPRATRSYRVAGVLPPDFRFTYPEETQAWLALPWTVMAAANPRSLASEPVYQLVGRLVDGVTIEQADVRLRALDPMGAPSAAAPPTAPVPRQPSFVTLSASPIRDWVLADARPELYLLSAVVCLLLVITSVTAASIIVLRGIARRDELAVRTALGADRGRLARQLVTEGFALCLGAAGIGIVAAAVLLPMLRRILPGGLPRGDEVSPAVGVLLVTGGVAIAMTMIAALVPLRSLTRFDIRALLSAKEHASDGGRWLGWRQRILAVQSAIATALLLAAGLLLVSFWRLGHVPLGFSSDHVVTLETRLLDPKYRDPTRIAAFLTAAVNGVRAVPGIRDVGVTSAVPFRGTDFTSRVGRADGGRELPAALRMVDSAYFDVMNVSLVRGRWFNSADNANGPNVAIISESLARNLFGANDPIGQAIDSEVPKRIVGIVRDVRYAGFDEAARPAVYISVAQHPENLICIVARTALPLDAVAPALRRAIHAADPAVPAMNVTTVDRILDESIADRRFYTFAAIAFSSIALVITLAGLSAIVARTVIDRRRELAIRVAMGAEVAHLRSVVARDGVAPVIVGTACGLALTALVVRQLAGLLFDTRPLDPGVWIAVPVSIVLIGVVAAALAGRGLLRMAPMDILRGD